MHIIKQSEDYYTIIKNEHHCISDGWSGPILLTTVHEYYELLVGDKEVRVKEDSAYIKTQEYINRHKAAVHGYWEKLLAGVEGANDINALLSEPVELSNYKTVEQPSKSSLIIKGEQYTRLKQFSQREGITVNVVVQFIWHKLLAVYSGQHQTVVGTTVSGRDLPVEGIGESVGLYINTLPLLVDWDNDNAIREQLHQIQDRVTALSTHSFADLAKLQQYGERLFHSLLVYENYPLPKGEAEDHVLSKISIRDVIEKVNYPLSVLAYEHNDTLTIRLQYDGKYLSEEKAGNHIAILENLVHQVLESPQQLQRTISLLSTREYNEIVHEWNATDMDYPGDRTVYELFQLQAARTPDNIALVYEGEELTYRELNERSNQLARHIRAQYLARAGKELVADTLIALCLERSLEMVIGILGVLKAGGAYVPMDIGYPQERIDYMLEDTQAVLVLSQRALSSAAGIRLPGDKVIYIDLSEDLYREEDVSNLALHSSANDLAYVIYTSGTTGKPKGVMINHSGIVNRI